MLNDFELSNLILWPEKQRYKLEAFSHENKIPCCFVSAGWSLYE